MSNVVIYGWIQVRPFLITQITDFSPKKLFYTFYNRSAGKKNKKVQTMKKIHRYDTFLTKVRIQHPEKPIEYSLGYFSQHNFDIFVLIQVLNPEIYIFCQQRNELFYHFNFLKSRLEKPSAGVLFLSISPKNTIGGSVIQVIKKRPKHLVPRFCAFLFLITLVTIQCSLVVVLAKSKTLQYKQKT